MYKNKWASLEHKPHYQNHGESEPTGSHGETRPPFRHLLPFYFIFCFFHRSDQQRRFIDENVSVEMGEKKRFDNCRPFSKPSQSSLYSLQLQLLRFSIDLRLSACLFITLFSNYFIVLFFCVRMDFHFHRMHRLLSTAY